MGFRHKSQTSKGGRFRPSQPIYYYLMNLSSRVLRKTQWVQWDWDQMEVGEVCRPALQMASPLPPLPKLRSLKEN